MLLRYASIFQSENLVVVYICIRTVKLVLYLTKNFAGLQQQYQDNLTDTDAHGELRANYGHNRALQAAQHLPEGWGFPRAAELLSTKLPRYLHAKYQGTE